MHKTAMVVLCLLLGACNAPFRDVTPAPGFGNGPGAGLRLIDAPADGCGAPTPSVPRGAPAGVGGPDAVWL